jgi:hypothetical protein
MHMAEGGMHMAGGGMHRGGRGDARASCASPLGTPLLLMLVIECVATDANYDPRISV